MLHIPIAVWFLFVEELQVRRPTAGSSISFVVFDLLPRGSAVGFTFYQNCWLVASYKVFAWVAWLPESLVWPCIVSEVPSTEKGIAVRGRASILKRWLGVQKNHHFILGFARDFVSKSWFANGIQAEITQIPRQSCCNSFLVKQNIRTLSRRKRRNLRRRRMEATTVQNWKALQNKQNTSSTAHNALGTKHTARLIHTTRNRHFWHSQITVQWVADWSNPTVERTKNVLRKTLPQPSSVIWSRGLLKESRRSVWWVWKRSCGDRCGKLVVWPNWHP